MLLVQRLACVQVLACAGVCAGCQASYHPRLTRSCPLPRSAPDLANMMFGLARLKVIPNRSWMAALLAASQANMQGCGAAHLARLIFGVAQVRAGQLLPQPPRAACHAHA